MLRIIIVLIINLDNYSVLLCLVIVMLYVPAIRVSAEMIFEMYYKVNDSFILEREKQEEFITYAWQLYSRFTSIYLNFYNPFLLPITFLKFIYLELTFMEQNEEALGICQDWWKLNSFAHIQKKPNKPKLTTFTGKICLP